MPELILHSAGQILAAALVQTGVVSDAALWADGSGSDWPCFYDDEPPEPAECVTCYETTPQADGRAQLDGEQWYHYGVQVRVRAGTAALGRAKVGGVLAALNRQINQMVVTLDATDYVVWAVTRTQLVPQGKGDLPGSKRRVYFINGFLALQIRAADGLTWGGTQLVWGS